MRCHTSRPLACFTAALLCLGSLVAPAHAAGEIVITPKYEFAGAQGPYYIEESYYSAPVVADLNGDGKPEVVNAAYTLNVMDAASGTLLWRVNAGRDRSTPYAINENPGGQVFTDVLVQDIDGDGSQEIIVGYGSGQVSVLDANGYFKPGWPQQPATSSIRSLATADVDHDGQWEIIVGAGIASGESCWMYRSNGTLCPGWPQLDANHDATKSPGKLDSGYGYGLFSNGIATGNLDGDADLEIIFPTDTAYIEAYHSDGSLVIANPVYGGRAWGKVALYEDYNQEKRCENEGWGLDIIGGETRAQLNRAELGHAAAVYSDVDGDGVSEVVITALITDRTGHSNTNTVTVADTRYMTVFLLNQDRTRFAKNGYDWTTPPIDLGGARKAQDDVSVATGVFSEPVCSDLNGDGKQEILFNAYNGKLHCFGLDGKEHGNWPFRLPQNSDALYEYAAPPATADLDGDGKKEVIVASRTANAAGTNTGVNGALYVLDSDGTLLASRPLHNGYSTFEGVICNSNGVNATPTLADIDGDGQLEVLLNTSYYGLCAYEVTGAPAAAPNAVPSATKLVVDGKPVAVDAYRIGENNYMKLRDLATLVNGSKKQFEVDWNNQQKVINLLSAAPYTPTAGDMAQGDGQSKYAVLSTSKVQLDGKEAPLTAYLIGQNNYFKLRDVMAAFDVFVGYDNATGTATLDTAKSYIAP
ncbi:MAG: FG-GAP-like repeat-containing protein [Pseudoflavonifractor sp.]